MIYSFKPLHSFALTEIIFSVVCGVALIKEPGNVETSNVPECIQSDQYFVHLLLLSDLNA